MDIKPDVTILKRITFRLQLRKGKPLPRRTKDGCCEMKTMSSFFSSFFALLLIVLYLSSSVVFGTDDGLAQYPYIRESTALILENISNNTQTEYYWGIPLDLVPKLSYLEVKEKKTGATDLFLVERALEDHAYLLEWHIPNLQTATNIQDPNT